MNRDWGYNKTRLERKTNTGKSLGDSESLWKPGTKPQSQKIHLSHNTRKCTIQYQLYILYKHCTLSRSLVVPVTTATATIVISLMFPVHVVTSLTVLASMVFHGVYPHGSCLMTPALWFLNSQRRPTYCSSCFRCFLSPRLLPLSLWFVPWCLLPTYLFSSYTLLPWFLLLPLLPLLYHVVPCGSCLHSPCIIYGFYFLCSLHSTFGQSSIYNVGLPKRIFWPLLWNRIGWELAGSG